MSRLAVAAIGLALEAVIAKIEVAMLFLPLPRLLPGFSDLFISHFFRES